MSDTSLNITRTPNNGMRITYIDANDYPIACYDIQDFVQIDVTCNTDQGLINVGIGTTLGNLKFILPFIGRVTIVP